MVCGVWTGLSLLLRSLASAAGGGISCGVQEEEMEDEAGVHNDRSIIASCGRWIGTGGAGTLVGLPLTAIAASGEIPSLELYFGIVIFRVGRQLPLACRRLVEVWEVRSL